MEIILLGGNTLGFERNTIASVLCSKQDGGQENATYFEVFTVDENFGGSVSCIPLVSPLSIFSRITIASCEYETTWEEGDWTKNEQNGEIVIKDVNLCPNPLPNILHITFQCPISTSEVFIRPEHNEINSLTDLVPMLWSEYLVLMIGSHSTPFIASLQRSLSATARSLLLDSFDFTNLDMRFKQLSGNLPCELGQLSSLKKLYLSRNKFSGQIPCELCQLGSLQELYLSNNQLSGNIPNELGQISSLEFLSLHDNKFSGNVPRELGQLSSLQYLLLSNNKLCGNIPSEFGQLSKLKELNTSNNKLCGNIPSELGQLSSLENLRSSNNQLSGNIPVELCQLSSLKFLHLSDNQLSGHIPIELAQLLCLKYMNLSNNQLSGNIPREFGQLSSLEGLYLDNNQFSGSIPRELGQLSSLKFLDLNNNQLSGSIPDDIFLMKFSKCNLSENYFLEHEVDPTKLDTWDTKNYNKILPRKSARGVNLLREKNKDCS